MRLELSPCLLIVLPYKINLETMFSSSRHLCLDAYVCFLHLIRYGRIHIFMVSLAPVKVVLTSDVPNAQMMKNYGLLDR